MRFFFNKYTHNYTSSIAHHIVTQLPPKKPPQLQKLSDSPPDNIPTGVAQRPCAKFTAFNLR